MGSVKAYTFRTYIGHLQICIVVIISTQFLAYFQTLWSNPSERWFFFSQNYFVRMPSISGLFSDPLVEPSERCFSFSQNDFDRMPSISGLFSDPLVEYLWTQIVFPQNYHDPTHTISSPFSEPLIESLWTHHFSQNYYTPIRILSGQFPDPMIESLWTHIFFSKNDCEKIPSISGLFSHPLIESLGGHIFFSAKWSKSYPHHFWPMFRPPDRIPLDADFFRKIIVNESQAFLAYFQTLWSNPSGRRFFSQNYHDPIHTISGLFSDSLIEYFWT